MLQEQCWAEILCEQIGSVFIRGYIEKLNRSKFDLFPDIVMSYLYMFDSLLGNRVLRIKYSTATISIEENKVNPYGKFSEQWLEPCKPDSAVHQMG